MAYLNGNSGQATAKNGNSIDADGNVVLGNDVGDVAMEAALESDREIVDGGNFSVTFSSAPNSVDNLNLSSQEIILTDSNSNQTAISQNEMLLVSAQGWGVSNSFWEMQDTLNGSEFLQEGNFDSINNANFGATKYISTNNTPVGIFFLNSLNIQYYKSPNPVADSGIGHQFDDNIEVNGAVFNKAPQTVVGGSVSGTATFCQPDRGSSDMRVKIYLDALDGTADYTFPTPFTFTPVVLNTNGLATTIVTTLDTVHVEVTGTGVETGFLIIEGF